MDQAPVFPEIEDQDQEQAAALPMVAVPVKVEGPVVVMTLPSRMGPAFFHTLSTVMTHILGPDKRRKRVTLISDVDWVYSQQMQGGGVPWYAKVALVLEHADVIYAKSANAGTLTVIAEYTGQ